jgi:hypothetical protein
VAAPFAEKKVGFRMQGRALETKTAIIKVNVAHRRDIAKVRMDFTIFLPLLTVCQ